MIRPRPSSVVWIVIALACTAASIAQAENWPQWRGPEGNGVSSERDLPIAWNEKSGIIWKVPLPGYGASTPAIWGDAIFVTAQVDKELKLLRLNKADGATQWARTIGEGTVPGEAITGKAKFHDLQNFASPSPVTDGETVVVHFGNGDLAAYDFDGNRRWKLNLTEKFGPYSIWWGHANSPVIYQNLVISVCMQDSLAAAGEEPKAKSYLVAHDLKTGKQLWQVDRATGANAEECDAYTTPLLVKAGERMELVVMGGNQVDAYDPATGTQYWFLPSIVGGRTVTGPTAAHGMVFVTQGMRGPLLGIRPGGDGERPRRDIVWRDAQGTPDTCCPVVWGDLLFTIADDGIVRCFEARTGQLKWKNRLKGGYKASPIAVQGRIYFVNTDGLATVVSAAPRFDKLTENQLDDQIIASPAVSGGRIYLRGKKSLYAIGY